MRFVSKAARSPGFSIAGPEVILKETPSSFAIIPASVVLPSPGGPYKSTWSSDSPLIFAASIKTLRFSFAVSCQIYSEMVFGRKGLSPSILSSGISDVSSILFSKSNSSENSGLLIYQFLPICFNVIAISCSTGKPASKFARTGETSAGV